MMKILLVDKTNLTLQGQTVRDHDLTTKQTHSQLFLKLFLTLSLWTRSFCPRDDTRPHPVCRPSRSGCRHSPSLHIHFCSIVRRLSAHPCGLIQKHKNEQKETLCYHPSFSKMPRWKLVLLQVWLLAFFSRQGVVCFEPVWIPICFEPVWIPLL